ncbi:uncharacterized protein METZ01_LOCUS307039, partial [marine metagenome]
MQYSIGRRYRKRKRREEATQTAERVTFLRGFESSLACLLCKFGDAISYALPVWLEQAVTHVLYDGLDAFAARLAAAVRASRSLDAQYYLYHGDVTGMLFADRLLSVAERGVPVRLLVDDMDMR